MVEVQKNAYETLRVERTTYKDIPLVAVRAWTGLPGDDDARPTRKGLTLRPEIWRKVLPAIEAALAEVEKTETQETADDDSADA
jgi:hypothetical protein